MGSRIVEIHNGSSLFTGDAGQGASNLRKFIIEHDLLEAIVAMPENMFYNTGIGTFVWVISNKKEERRRGKIQLIDATGIKTPLRKNLGEKNCEVNEADRAAIVKLLMDFENTPQSKIFDNEEFGYWSITVERPLRLVVKPDGDISAARLNARDLARFQAALRAVPADTPLDDWNRYAEALALPKTLLKKVRPYITERNPDAVPVVDEFDPELRDTEQVPLLYPGGIDAFMQAEVLPYAPDAVVDEDQIKIGYELSFTKYFYKPMELPAKETLAEDIRGLEASSDGMLNEILNFGN